MNKSLSRTVSSKSVTIIPPTPAPSNPVKVAKASAVPIPAIQQRPSEKKEKKKIKREIAKVINKNPLYSRRVLGLNPYLQTLLDPFNKQGAKIPDECMYPSVPFTIVDRRTLTVNAQGIAMVCYGRYYSHATAPDPWAIAGSLVPMNYGPSSVYYLIAGMTHSAAATATDLILQVGSTPIPSIVFPQWGIPPAQDTVGGAFDKVRLVSAGLNVQFTGNFTQNSGKYTAAFVPRQYTYDSYAGNEAIPLSFIQQMPTSRSAPINLNEGITVRYEPLDTISNQYSEQGVRAYDPVNDKNWSGLLPALGGEMWVCIDGAPPGTTFNVVYTGNYEGVPKSNSFLLTSVAEASQNDPIAMTHALRVSDAAPNVVVSSAEANNEIVEKVMQAEEMSTTAIEHEQPSMFDKMVGLMNKFGSVVENNKDKILPLAETLLATL